MNFIEKKSEMALWVKVFSRLRACEWRRILRRVAGTHTDEG